MSLNKSYIPFTTRVFPERTDQHYLEVTKDDGTVFDESYPYIDKSKKFLRKQWWVRVLLYTIVFPLSYIRFGLRIRGRKNIHRHKAVLKQGVISISNHVHMWDYICTMNAIRPFRSYLLAWSKNVTGKDGPLVRLVGGIPIPENDPKATIAYMKALGNLFDSGGWLHIYPEGSMWELYRYIRPFKRGVAHLAILYHKPVLPLGFSYRKPCWFRRVFFKQKACLNLCIGEPIYINETLSAGEQEIDLLNRCHDAVLDLVDLTRQENGYEAIFNNSKRIDY